MATVRHGSTLAFLREGYAFVSSRCDALGTDLFTGRLGLVPVTFLRGAEAAELFYGGDRFTRRRSMPPQAQRLLQDKGSVQLLDGDAHRHRSAAFLSLMGPAAMARLGDLLEEEWRAAERRWQDQGRIVLHHEAREILTRTACRWAEAPLAEDEVATRTRQFALLVDDAPRPGPPNWYARARRRSTERWAAGIVEQVRSGRLDPAPGTAAHVAAHFRELDGQLLPPEVAAVELINVLRSTVAVSRFLALAAVALHEHPQWREAFAAGDESDLEPFAQGGGRHGSGHRCPGEWRTVELLKRAVRLLAASDHEVPAQDLSVRLNHLPAVPRSGFVLCTGAAA